MIPRSKPQNAMDCPLVQYASGHTKFRNDRSARSWSGLVGFHAECGVVPAFDHACTAAGYARIDIRHTTGRDQAEIKQHWYLGEELSIWPVTGGPVAETVAGLLRRRTAAADAGIGVAWGNGERSRLAFRGWIQGLGLVQLGVRSRMTDYLLAALLRHTAVCDVADTVFRREVGFHELALPLGVAAEEVPFGTNGHTVAVWPLVARWPEPVTAEHVREARCSPALLDTILSFWPAVQAWAAGYGVRDNGA